MFFRIGVLTSIEFCGDAEQTVQMVLGSDNTPSGQIFQDKTGYNESLGLCLSVGRGRRFVRTIKGRLGLVPAIGTKPASKSRFRDDGTCEVVET